jgi:hypothetical protein
LNTSKIEVLRRPIEFTLDSVVGMNDPASGRLAILDRHVEGIDDESRVLRVVD